MVAAGVTLGIGASMIAAPLLKSLLYGVAPLDPWSLCSAALLVALIAAAATVIPVMHATRIDPASALRQEQ
jgi:putative ABC transport system permease protein